MDMTNGTLLTVEGAGYANSEEKIQEGFAWKSLLILFAFFLVILALFMIGLGCAYLSYKYATNNRNKRLEKEERERLERRQQQLRYRALAAAQFFRGVPNSYSPNPKDEHSHLLDFSTVPVQIQTE